MRIRRLQLTAGAVGATLIAAAGLMFAGGQAQAATAVKIMPLGDSITDGFNVPGGYRITLKPKLDAGGYTTDFVGTMSNGPASLTDREHQGLTGWRIDQLDANIVTWLQQTTPDTVLLHAGTNDAIQGIDIANAATRLGALIDKITATVPNAVVIVASIVPLTDATQEARVKTFNAGIPAVVSSRAAAGKKVYFTDMHAALTTADLADGIHPSEAGYAKMATQWYSALRSVSGALGGGSTPTTVPTTAPSPSPTTSSPTVAPTTATPGPTLQPAGACSAALRVVGSWQGGFQGAVTITNGGSAISKWSVAWTPSGYTVAQSWGASVTTNGSLVVAANAAWNGALPASGTTEFGFIGSGSAPGAGLLTCTA
jgi:lysophospholipase L1-like esterase